MYTLHTLLNIYVCFATVSECGQTLTPQLSSPDDKAKAKTLTSVIFPR